MGRKRLRPWVEDRINRNLYPGLMWVDKEKKIFRFPWKDKKNHSWRPSDAQIFKDWATVTSKHRPGDPECPCEWKAQLRNAFRRVSDFMEIPKEHKLTGTDDPYKVYRILDKVQESKDESSNRACEFDADSSDTSSSTTSQINLMDSSYLKVNGIRFGDEAIEVEGLANLNVPTVVYETPHFQGHCTADAQNNICSPETGTHHLHQISSSIDHFPNSQLSQLQLPALEEHPEMPSCLEDIVDYNDTPSLPVMDVDRSSMALDAASASASASASNCAVKYPVLRVEVFLAGQLVLKESIDDQGARLFCGDSPNHVGVVGNSEHQHVYGPKSLKQICIPDIDKIGEACAIDEYKKQPIRAIQKHMKRGLIFRGTGLDISTERLCKTRVHMLTQEGMTRKLKRTESSSEFVFDSKLFKDHLQRYISRGGCLPSPSVIFTFGTKYESDPIGQNTALFCAKVTHIDSETLLKQEISKHPGISETFFSSTDLNDVLAEMFDGLRPFDLNRQEQNTQVQDSSHSQRDGVPVQGIIQPCY